MLCFPGIFDGFTVAPAFTRGKDFRSFQQIRLIPHRNRIVIGLVFKIEVSDKKEDKGRCLGIDIGVNNLAACRNNDGLPAFAINGRILVFFMCFMTCTRRMRCLQKNTA